MIVHNYMCVGMCTCHCTWNCACMHIYVCASVFMSVWVCVYICALYSWFSPLLHGFYGLNSVYPNRWHFYLHSHPNTLSNVSSMQLLAYNISNKCLVSKFWILLFKFFPFVSLPPHPNTTRPTHSLGPQVSWELGDSSLTEARPGILCC